MNTPPHSTTYGLAAIGRSGDVKVEIHEALDDTGRWEVAIGTRHAEIRYRTAGPESIRELHAFLHENGTAWGDAPVGTLFGNPVVLVRDHPPAVRYWFKTMKHEEGYFAVVFSDSSVVDLRRAMTQAIDDLT